MISKKWLFLISSAVLYALPFMLSQSMWFLVFIFLVPLFYAAMTERLTFKDGLLFGILFWGLHLSGVLYSIYVIAWGNLYLRLIPIVFILLYQALFVGLWFWLSGALLRLFKIHSTLMTLLVWVVTTVLYFYWLDNYSLALFNTFEGYFLMHPLLPLAEVPAFLTFLSTVGKMGLMVLLILTNALFAYPMVSSSRKSLFFLFLGAAPWVISYGLQPEPLKTPDWVGKVAHVPTIFYDSINLTVLADIVQEKIKEVLKNHPSTEIIIFPEYSFDRVNVSTAQEITSLWSSKYVGKPLHLLIGALYWEGEKPYNAVYWIYDGKVKGMFRKRHSMVLVEGVSSWYDFKFIRSLYHVPMPPVQVSDNPRLSFDLNGVQAVPYICSELFFNDQPDDAYKQATVFGLCKDTWAKIGYVRRLMYLAARFKAIEWQRDVVYASYFYGSYIDKNGRTVPIN